jgi:hypothetical protein
MNAPTNPLEKALQASLRAVDPGTTFTAALQARLAKAEPHALAADRASPGAAIRLIPSIRQRRQHSALLGLAASIVVAVGVAWQLLDLRAEQRAAQVRLEQAQLHSQVLLALEIASERLSLAQLRIEQYPSQEKSL